METLYTGSGPYAVIADGCPGLKLYDTLLRRVAFGHAAYYDNMDGDGRTALEYARAACDAVNARFQKRMRELSRLMPSEQRKLAGVRVFS